MRSNLPAVFVALVLAVLLVAVVSTGGGPRPAPLPASAGSAADLPDPGRDAEPPPVPAAVSLPLPGTAAPPLGSAPDEEEGGPRVSPHAALIQAALAQLGPVLVDIGDVAAYLDGRSAGEWRFVEVSPQERDKLLALLTFGQPKERLEAALALSVAKLRPEDLVSLRSRFDVELLDLKGEAAKNLVLALSFVLDVHGDRHGVAALADALQTGLNADVNGFRSGAALILAIAEDLESAPLLRELLLEDPDRGVRKNAAAGLGRLGGEENRLALAESLVREGDVEVRAWSALAAGRAAADATAANEVLDDTPLRRALSEDPAGEVRGAAAFALGQSGGSGTEQALEAVFYGDDHPFARIGAVAGIATGDEDGSAAEFLSGQGAPYLAGLVRTSGDTVARFYAVTALAMLPPSADRSTGLREAAANDASFWVKAAAIDRLVETEGEAARPFLDERLAAEEGDRARTHLEAALKRLGGE